MNLLLSVYLMHFPENIFLFFYRYLLLAALHSESTMKKVSRQILNVLFYTSILLIESSIRFYQTLNNVLVCFLVIST